MSKYVLAYLFEGYIDKHQIDYCFGYVDANDKSTEISLRKKYVVIYEIRWKLYTES